MTRDDTDGRARRGYLILAGILLAAVLIFNIQAVSDIAGERTELVALLPDASGVRVGTPVWVAGVEAGRITAIRFLSGGDSADIALHIVIRGDGVSVIRRDSDVRAIRLRVVGQPIVQIEAGSSAAPPVRAGDTLRARGRGDPFALLEQGKALPATLDSLMTSARRVAAMAGSREPELARLRESVAAMNAAAGALSLDLEGGSLGAMMAPGGLDGLGNLRARLAELAAAVDAASTRYRGADGVGSPLGASLESLQGRVAALDADLDALATRMQAGGGILYRMPRDSALQVALRGVRAQIDSVRQEAASIALRMFIP